MTDTSLQDAHVGFVEQIRREPDNDGHRLIYADWLEEEGGRPRWAEFIRRSIALEDRLSNCRRCRGPCRWCVETSKEDLWVNRNYPDFFAGTGIHPDRAAKFGLGFSRGMLIRVTVSAFDWITCGDQILLRNPLQEVILTSWPKLFEKAWYFQYLLQATYQWRLQGDPSGTKTHHTFDSLDDAPNVSVDILAIQRSFAVMRLLKKRWPGILFVPPSTDRIVPVQTETEGDVG